MDLGSDLTRQLFRWPVSANIQIAAPVDTVWRIIASPDSLIAAHPFLADNPIEAWPGANSRDEVRYLSGVVYERRFRGWQDGEGFDLEVFHKGKESAWVSWRIVPVGTDRTNLFVLRPRLRAYLESVVRGYEWYITKGEPVPRNQFGAHPWYSKG